MRPRHPAPVDEKDPAESLLRILPELQALPAHRVRRVCSSIPHLVQIALGALPHLRTLRPRINALPEFDATVCDRLEDYALGLMHANTLWRSARHRSDDLPAVLKACAALKHNLLCDVQSLAAQGLIDARSLRNLEGYRGYQQVASDLHLLSTLLKENLATIDGHCGTTAEDLQRADRLVMDMRRRIGERLVGPSTSREEADDLRARAYTMTLEAWSEIERAADFLLCREPSLRATAFPSPIPGRPRSARRSWDKNTSGGT